MFGPGAKSLHHATAHHAPTQRAHYFPEHDAIGIEATSGVFISGEQFFPRPKSADWLIDLAEAPRIDAYPAEILHGIADVGEFPIQHRSHPVRTDDEIAMAKVAVHQCRLRGRARIALAEPAQRQLEHRTWPFKAAIVTFKLGDFLCRRHAAKLRQLSER